MFLVLFFSGLILHLPWPTGHHQTYHCAASLRGFVHTFVNAQCCRICGVLGHAVGYALVKRELAEKSDTE